MKSVPPPLPFAPLLSLAAVCLGLSLALAAPLMGAVPAVPATPPNYVVDLAGVIDDPVEARMNAQLRELEERTTAQVVVLTLPSLEGESLEAFSIDLAHNRWKLGQKGKDNGVLLTLAMMERRYRIEVGYGLEGVLPDSLAGTIGREQMMPAFRAGDFGGGLAAAAGEIAALVAAASGVSLSQAPAVAPRSVRAPPSRAKPGPLNFVVLLLAGAVFLWLLIKHPQLLILMLLSSRGGGSRGSWGGGGGGGFGGGGGGGFGGGGASGSW